MHPLRRNVRHHKLKLDCEEMLIESGLLYSIIQPIRYMQHVNISFLNKSDTPSVLSMPFDINNNRIILVRYCFIKTICRYMRDSWDGSYKIRCIR